MDQEDLLGPLEAWQIREFPRDLRVQIVAAAKDRRMSPGEFATQIFIAARDAGWDGFQSSAPGGNGVRPVADPADMVRAAIEAAEAAGVPVRKGMARQAMAHATEQLMAARGLQAPRRAPRALPAPAPATE